MCPEGTGHLMDGDESLLNPCAVNGLKAGGSLFICHKNVRMWT